MVKEMRKKGEMMDKRSARKIYGREFRTTIATIDAEWTSSSSDPSSSKQPPKDALKHVSSPNQSMEPATTTATATWTSEPSDDDDRLDNTLPSAAFSIYVRKRPLFDHERAEGEYDIVSTCDRHTSVVVHACQMHPDMKHKFVLTHRTRFAHVFGDHATTREVYDTTTEPLLQHALSGGQSVVMMNGQTGSGKSHTMKGLECAIAADLFQTDVCRDRLSSVTITMLEVMGAKVTDLLNGQKVVSVCDDGASGIALVGASACPITCPEDLTQAIARGTSLRATESTTVNSVSSRSHCLVRLQLASCNNTVGQLTLLDLAGSERNADSAGHSAERMAESIDINKSHLALKRCIQVFVANANAVSGATAQPIPFRQSVLTRLLKGCLWQQGARAAIIATVSPTPTDTEHTLRTLEYAAMMQSDASTRTSVKTDVVEAVKKEVLTMKDWNHETVRAWFSALKPKTSKQTLQPYVKNLTSGIDGKQLLRLSLARFVQLCDGNTAEGEYAYNAVRRKVKAGDTAEIKRRELHRQRR